MGQNSSIDYNGNRIVVENEVLVPKPNPATDIYKKEFVGKIREFNNNGSAKVMNDDGESFDLVPNRLEGLPKNTLIESQ